VTALVDVPYTDEARVAAFYDRLSARLAGLPGVQAAGAASQIPLGGNFDMWGVHVEGETGNPSESPSADFYAVTPGYRAALRIPLVRGRDLEARDGRDSPAVVLVNESLARRFWPGQSPLGRRLKLGGDDGPWRTIVGVVGDVRHHGLDARPQLQVYVPHAQVSTSMMAVVLRTTEPALAAAGLRAAVAEADPGVPVARLRSGEDLLETAVAERRFVSRLLTAFAAAAAGLVAVGVAGALAQFVSQRRREMAVRLALGARPSQVLALALRHGLAPVAAGVGAGLLLAPLGGRALEPMLFEVSAADPVSLVAVATGLAAVALAASALPARRAARLEPALVLRGE
jgi:putative ABC transport system permease protein